MTTRLDRFVLLATLLDLADYEFVEALDPPLAKRFRRQRMQIMRAELRAITREVGLTFLERAARLEAGAYWRGYPSLIHSTALTYCAIARLRLASMLFSWHLPVLIDVGATTDRLARYAMAGASCVAPSRSLG